MICLSGLFRRFNSSFVLSLGSGIFFLFAAFLAPLAFADEITCTKCVSGNQRLCKNICAKNPRAECLPQCLSKQCEWACVKKPPPPPRPKPPPKIIKTTEQMRLEREMEESPCASCVAQKEKNECLAECKKIGYGSSPACKSKCAKRRCASACLLPDSDAKVTETPQLRDCFQCKTVEERACEQACGEDKEAAGHLACVVGCVEEQCRKDCNPDDD